MLLAGDIGGTKADLALFDAVSGPRSPVHREVFESKHYPSLAALIRQFQTKHREPITSACLAVAGPVVDGRANVTNLAWLVDEVELATALQIPRVTLINDLVATALSVPLLGPDDVATLATGKSARPGTVAVVAPGTGLGEAFLTWEGALPHAHPSEGGHCDFAPADAQQARLLAYLRERHTHVSVERVCSGSGIPNIYAFLRDSGQAPESPELRRLLAAADDPTPIIATAATTSPFDPLCRASLEMFVAILAAEAGNLALKVCSTGGMYLAGGIPKRILSFLDTPQFLETFTAKGRMESFLRAIPVHVVLEQTALFGCASFGLRGGGELAGSPRSGPLRAIEPVRPNRSRTGASK